MTATARDPGCNGIEMGDIYTSHAITVAPGIVTETTACSPNPSIRHAERSWRTFRFLLSGRCRRSARRLSAEALRLVIGQNSGLGSAAQVCLLADLDFA